LLDFRYTRELLAAGYRQTLDYFARGTGAVFPAELLPATPSVPISQ